MKHVALNRRKENPKHSPNASCFMKHASSSRGFTLIETFIAIVILTTAIAGPMTLAQRSLSSSIYSKDQITAYYLAQEAIEYVKNIRDNNSLLSTPTIPLSWLNGLSLCLVENGCEVDVTADTDVLRVIAAPQSGSFLKFNSVTGVYGYVSGVESNFKRNVKITSLTADEALVAIKVSWKSGSIGKEFTITDHIFNWHR